MGNRIRQKEAPKKEKKTNKVFSKTLQALLSGEFLTKQGVIKHFPFIAFLFTLFAFQIAWQYEFENTERAIIKTQKELEELHSEYNTTMSKLETSEQQSQVAIDIEKTGLKEPTSPFRIIEADKSYFEE